MTCLETKQPKTQSKSLSHQVDSPRQSPMLRKFILSHPTSLHKTYPLHNKSMIMIMNHLYCMIASWTCLFDNPPYLIESPPHNWVEDLLGLSHCSLSQFQDSRGIFDEAARIFQEEHSLGSMSRNNWSRRMVEVDLKALRILSFNPCYPKCIWEPSTMSKRHRSTNVKEALQVVGSPSKRKTRLHEMLLSIDRFFFHLRTRNQRQQCKQTSMDVLQVSKMIVQSKNQQN